MSLSEDFILFLFQFVLLVLSILRCGIVADSVEQGFVNGGSRPQFSRSAVGLMVFRLKIGLFSAYLSAFVVVVVVVVVVVDHQ